MCNLHKIIEVSGVRYKGQHGYTLVELIVTIAIIGFLSAILALTFDMVTKVSMKSIAQNNVLSQVHIAGNWISRDVESADNVTLGYAGNRLCLLYRYRLNGTSIVPVKIEYQVVNGVLNRLVNDGAGTQIAQYISGLGADTTFASSSENNTYLLTVKAVYGSSSYTGVYKINQRVP